MSSPDTCESAQFTARFGTSSWAYEGWQGLVYHRRYSKATFSRNSLAEYAAYAVEGRRLFRTVGIDHSFYRPPSRSQLTHYADLVPDDFQFCLKVWEELTIPKFAKVPRYGAKGGTHNPRFLDTALFHEFVAAPAIDTLGDKLGVFLFEFQRTGIEPDAFLDALEPFLAKLPQGPRYAVEVREPAILGPRYAGLLHAHGVGHVFNHWTAMPPLLTQLARLGGTFPASTVVVRLLTPLGLPHQEAVDRYRPYDRIVVPQAQMRTETVTLARNAVAAGYTPYVLVNNRAEGNAPLTIQALVQQLKH